jgi:hypothetical protein
LVDIKKIYIPEKLSELQEIARTKGGKLISKIYLGVYKPLEWKCKNSHTWKAAPNNIKNSGSWCPYCYGRNKSIKDMNELAANFAGKCLSDTYINNNTHLLWQCSNGHTFKSKSSNVLTGYWCPECGKINSGMNRRKYSIEDMQLIASKNNGQCLSNDYLGYKTKLLWQCKNGHTWEASPEKMLNTKKWCKKCNH